jgi:hypothetical protein
MAKRPRSNRTLNAGYTEFRDAHPELNEKLSLWMADASLFELQDLQAAMIFRKAFPELAGPVTTSGL